MTHSPKVSVVLTTYNRADSLRETVLSILGQSFQDFELIVSDDCSPDHTCRVVEDLQETDNRIIYRRNKRNLGMPGNLNAGIALARGDLIANLHDGDVYVDRLLARWSDALEACPTAAFVFNGYRYLDERGFEAGRSSAGLPACTPGHYLLEKVYFRSPLFNSVVWGTCMVRREAYEALGLFNPAYGFWSDVEMWMRLCEEFDVAFVDEPLIALPSRASLPRQGGRDRHQELRMMERMFRSARNRHYRDDPYRLRLERIKHLSFFAYALAFRGLQAQLERVALLRPYVRRGPF